VTAFLGIDTAVRRGSVGLAPQGLMRALPPEGRHAVDLIDGIEALLAEAGCHRDDLRGIGVTVGPGSFTGVRIGLATARGLGYGLNIPVTGLSTLEAVACAAAGSLEGPLCAVLEAGRGEVYAALFTLHGKTLERLGPDQVLPPEALAPSLPRDVLLAGDGARLVAPLLASSGANAEPRIAPTRLLALVLAGKAASVGGAGYRPGEPAPHYIRSPDARVARSRP
jgi:tRNA threonylcarbamoyladenosine biosynthesis protein TsaB